MKTKVRIIKKGGKKEKTGLDEKTWVGVSTPVLIITQGFVFGSTLSVQSSTRVL